MAHEAHNSPSNRAISLRVLPNIPTKAALIRQSVQTHVEEAPYRALIGIVVDGSPPPRFRETIGHRTRNQTGLTNRWRSPESLYSDFLGSRQALKAVNLPFNQTLVKNLRTTYPAMNQTLLTCKDLNYINKSNWSVMKTTKTGFNVSDREEEVNLGSFDI